jgi:cell division protease FtsH
VILSRWYPSGKTSVLFEKIIFSDVTTGAQNDLKHATKLARDMVMIYGMSDKFGPIVLGEKEEMIFLGREISEQRNYSETKAAEIDSEVAQIIEDGRKLANQVLTKRKTTLKRLAKELVKKETLEGSELDKLFKA